VGIRDNLATLFGAKASVIGLPAGDQPDRPLEKTWDDWTLLSTYGDDPWPYICATKVAEQGSLPPLQFGTTDAKGNFQPVPPTHPLQDLFDRPNPLNTGGELRQLILLYMEMTGHAPIEIVRPSPSAKLNGKGTLGRKGFELYTHNPGPWRIVANLDGTIRGYLYLNSLTPQAGTQAGMLSRADLKWDASQMTYLRWPNPLNRWYGQGRIAAVRQAVMAEEYAGIRDKRSEQQLGIPPGILTSEMPLGGPQAEELQRRWEKAVGGYQNAGRIAVLGSKTTYQAVSMSRKDQEWLATRHWRVQEIAGAFEVPLVLVLMSEASYANAREARAEWWQGSLSVKLRRIEEMCTERLVPMLTDEPLEARFDLTRVAALNENANEVATRAETWSKTGTVRRIEIRSLLGLEPLGDDRDDEIVIPSQLRETATATVDPVTGEKPTPQGGAEGKPTKSAAPRRVKRREPAEREQILHPVREQWKSDLGSYFASQRNVLRPLGKAADVAQTKTDPGAFIERALALISGKRFRDRFVRISSGPVKTSIIIGATDAADAIGSSLTILASDQAVSRVTSYINSLAVRIQNTTNDDVKAVITDWMETGGTVAELQDGLSTLFDGYEEWRLDRIARTETVSAYNLGAVDQYRDAGVQLVEVSDGDGDDECAAADGATWTLDEAEADPSAHPNCTRTWIPITDFSDVSVDEAAAAPEPKATKTRIEYDAQGRVAALIDE
jgi:phage portal protein BeeE